MLHDECMQDREVKGCITDIFLEVQYKNDQKDNNDIVWFQFMCVKKETNKNKRELRDPYSLVIHEPPSGQVDLRGCLFVAVPGQL